MKKLSVLVMCLLLVPCATLAADARAALTAFTTGLETLSGRFEQRVTDANGREVDISQGSLALRAPRQFRFEYLTPFAQVIVADGDNVWIYDPDLEQVMVRAQASEEARSPLTLLTDLSQLDSDYVVQAMADADGLKWLRLIPKSDDAPFERCEIGFKDGMLLKMVIVDRLNQRNEMSFDDWQRNQSLAAGTFRFELPEGVDLVGTPVKSAEVIPLPQ